MPTPLEIRFREKYAVDPITGCWNWTAAKKEKGYGIFGLPYYGPVQKAHRVSYELHIGAIPDGHMVLHRCDNPGCVNPDHLFTGTAKDNTQDMIKKGRHRNRFSIKTKGKVSSPITQEEIA